jgi:hypothetical protein
MEEGGRGVKVQKEKGGRGAKVHNGQNSSLPSPPPPLIERERRRTLHGVSFLVYFLCFS